MNPPRSRKHVSVPGYMIEKIRVRAARDGVSMARVVEYVVNAELDREVGTTP